MRQLVGDEPGYRRRGVFLNWIWMAFSGGDDGEIIPSVMRHRRFKSGLKGPPLRERGGALVENRNRTEDISVPGHNFLKSIVESRTRISRTSGVKNRLMMMMNILGRILGLK
uniref:Uncharacterized protein n=1 Tax=Cucumis sativus TaxID=3659 RepID=A0A0A0KBW2_CUCSA